MVNEAEEKRTIKVAPEKLQRRAPPKETKGSEAEAEGVSAGPIDKVIELAFNPSREKIREVTIIDRMQGRLLPQLDVEGLEWGYVIEIATFRQDSKYYKEVYGHDLPISPNLMDEFIYRTAQWQKSVAGKNLERATDIALAETEARAGEEEETRLGVKDPFREE